MEVEGSNEEEEVERNLERVSLGGGEKREWGQRVLEEERRVRVSGFGLKKSGPSIDSDDWRSGGFKNLPIGNWDFNSSVKSILQKLNYNLLKQIKYIHTSEIEMMPLMLICFCNLLKLFAHHFISALPPKRKWWRIPHCL